MSDSRWKNPTVVWKEVRTKDGHVGNTIKVRTDRLGEGPKFV